MQALHGDLATVFAFASPNGQQGGGGGASFLIMMGLMFAIMWFLILRPQQKKQKEHKTMIDSLAKGDRIVTNGGLYADVLNVKDDVVVATISDGVKIELAKTAVAARVKSKKGGA